MKSMRTIADVEEHPEIFDKIAREWDVVQEIDDWAVTLAKKNIQWKTEFTWNEPRREERFHPSSLTKKCDYFVWLEMVGVNRKQITGRRERGIYDMGTCVHLMMNYYTESRAALHDYTHITEFEIEHFDRARELRMCGSADGMEERDLLGHEVRLIQEWKSCSNSSFQGLGKKPKIDHRRQICSYLYAADIPIGVIVYINKDTSAKRAFVTHFDQAIWTPLKQRMLRLLDLAHRFEEPDRHVTKSCIYCPFKRECNPDLNKVKTEDKPWMSSTGSTSSMNSTKRTKRAKRVAQKGHQ